jgi:hypothetical protein
MRSDNRHSAREHDTSIETSIRRQTTGWGRVHVNELRVNVGLLNYLPENRSDFSGPHDAASTWWQAIKKMSPVQWPLAVILALAAVALASVKRVRALLPF